MKLLDRVSKLPTDLMRDIKDYLDVETYTELLLCNKLKYKEVKKTVKNNYYETYVDDVNGSLEAIITNKIPAEVETLNEHTGDPWHFATKCPMKIPDELHYNIFKQTLYNPLEKLVNEDKTLVGQTYIGTIRSTAQVTVGLKLKERKHPLLNEIKNLLYEYHVPEKPRSVNERVLDRYNKKLNSVVWQLRESPTRPRESHLVYVLRGIRSFNNEFDIKVQRVVLNYLKALVVLTKPYCSGLVSKLLKGQTAKDMEIDADREGWKKDLKKAVKENSMMGREERYEKRRLVNVKRMETIESRRQIRRKLTEDRREKKRTEVNKKKELMKKKKEKAKEKERNKKLLAKLKAKNAKETEKAAKEAVKRKAKLAAKALKKAASMERTFTAALPSVRILFK
jgi:hypothetical protein